MRRLWPRILIGLLTYCVLCGFAGIVVTEMALHPARRPLSAEEIEAARQIAVGFHANLEDVAITAQDGIVLRAWSIRPQSGNNDAVILLHGLSDNRFGMIGYAQILLRHGYTVLMPDARAHGASGGDLATYGLLERDDIHRWSGWLAANQHPPCIYGLGESMGAAQLLQALATDSHFCAVVAESSFANFREIAYDRVGQFFGTGPWLGRTLLRPVVVAAFAYARWRYGFDMTQVSPEQAVAKSDVPVLLIHGKIDRNIPLRHSLLIRQRNPRVILWEVPNADHCGAISIAPAEFERKLLAWFADAGPSRRSRSALSTLSSGAEWITAEC
jgi:uncharacterized protein